MRSAWCAAAALACAGLLAGCQPDDKPSGTAAAFTEDMVRAHSVTKDGKGGQSNVRFVATSQNAETIVDLAKQCVAHFLQRTESAFCYGYGAEQDYAVKSTDWEPGSDEGPFGGGRPCWAAYVGQPLDGKTLNVLWADPLVYKMNNCPGQVRFPDGNKSTAEPGITGKHTDQDATGAVMPNVVCMNLQDAQDAIQKAGAFYSRSTDASGKGRHQVIDRNWVVVAQKPPAGQPISEGEANLSVVKNDEPNPC